MKIPARKSTRIKRVPDKYEDYYMCVANHEVNEAEEFTKTFQQVLDTEWRTAIEKERDNNINNDTWKLTKDTGQRRMDAVWKFKRKLDAKGHTVKKTILVARGCKQNANEKAYAHVPGAVTVRTFLAAAHHQSMIIELDYRN